LVSTLNATITSTEQNMYLHVNCACAMGRPESFIASKWQFCRNLRVECTCFKQMYVHLGVLSAPSSK